jgi:predicted alpha/beta superfamily hydrolase
MTRLIALAVAATPATPAALALALLIGGGLPAPACAQMTGAAAPDAAPLTVGETFSLESRVLGETRRINVYLPPGYEAAPDAPLPVLYMPDGGMAEDFLHVAGLFVVETLFLEPDLFDTYIAFDPSLWWNGGELVERASERLGVTAGRSVYLASSSQADIATLTARLAGLLQQRGLAGARWHYHPMPEESHATIYHPAALRAFRHLFPPAPSAE